MAPALTKRPEGVELNALSSAVFETLAEYTAFPWAVLAAQSKRVDADPASLTIADLKNLVDLLADGVGRFTSPEKRDRVRARLLILVRTNGG